MRTLTSVEAQNRFGELIDSAQREPVTITRRGRPVAFVLSPEDLKDLIASRGRRDRAFAELEAFFAAADSKLLPAAAALTDQDVEQLVDAVR
ncbi:MAG: type II toxin-antitoxin system Phd/YefM family antitoxin [Burkholderiaceae bacterium]|jgi:antitoxin Phd